jgi:2-oxoglutarate ferredoxin oxidoreductase subunit alpha
MKGMEHRIGGLEKQHISGAVSHDPENHQRMVEIRQEKINRIENDIPMAEIYGPQSGDLLVIAWGSSYGAVKTAIDRKASEGKEASFVHLRHLNPFPANLGSILKQFKRIFIPEMNLGQLKSIIQSKYLVPVIGLHKVQGQPFKATDIEEKLDELLD